jgi:glucan phosphoethanolaminetransferase (alkaline phosphatase superfamily)
VRQTYRVLAGLIALGVVVQAMVVAFGFFTVGHDVSDGKVLNETNFGEDGDYSPVGLVLHGFLGMTVIPAIAIILFIISFFAKVPGGVKWAGFVLLAVIVQVVLGLAAHSVPALGLLHGLNAFVVLGTAAMAARRAATMSSAAASAHETAAV